MHFFIVYFMKKVCREPLVKWRQKRRSQSFRHGPKECPHTVPHTVKTGTTPSLFDGNGPHDTLGGPEASISAGITQWWYNYFDPLAPYGSLLGHISLKMSSTTRSHAPPQRRPADAPTRTKQLPRAFPSSMLAYYTH